MARERRGRRRQGWVTSCALALFACGPSASDDGPTGAGGSDRLVDLDPTLSADEDAWAPCGGRIECRQIEVPIDHEDPTGATLEVALARSPHWEGYDFRGVIVVNPGGPGAPGRPFLQAFDARRALGLLRGFDLVSFDPRGVGDSGAVPCGSGTVPKVVFEGGGTPGLIDYFEADATACAERMGPLFDHLGSRDVVRDMELIRQALGQEQLNFLGASYGTRLAALYAETFPERVRAFVLDGPVHPVADLAEIVNDQFDALVAAVDEFFVECAEGVLDCPYDADFLAEDLWNRSVERDAEDLYAGLWKSSLTGPNGRAEMAEFLYTYELFPELWDELILSAFSKPSPQEVAVNQVVHCTDQSVDVPTSDQIEAAIARYTERSPQFAVTGLSLATCTGWHVAPNPVQRLTAAGAPPMLLIAGEHDILTPLKLGEEMQRSLESSVLVTSGHYGHGSVLVGSPCIDDLLESFFARLELPEDGTSCP
jgi:pimeloyl-ACP methyl ester carboxylesterase